MCFEGWRGGAGRSQAFIVQRRDDGTRGTGDRDGKLRLGVGLYDHRLKLIDCPACKYISAYATAPHRRKTGSQIISFVVTYDVVRVEFQRFHWSEEPERGKTNLNKAGTTTSSSRSICDMYV